MKDMKTELPRVELPNRTEDELKAISDFHEYMEIRERLNRNFLTALFSRGRMPFTGKPKRRPGPTKHQRHQARVGARSAYLESVGRSSKARYA